MTYNVFGGTLSLTQSIIISALGFDNRYPYHHNTIICKANNISSNQVSSIGKV